MYMDFIKSLVQFKGITHTTQELLSKIDLQDFCRNEAYDPTLPGVIAGGNIQIHKRIAGQIQAHPHYLCVYIYSGEVRICVEPSKQDTKEMLHTRHLLLLNTNTSLSFEILTKDLSLAIYFLQGDMITTYLKKIRNRSVSESFGYFVMQFSNTQMETYMNHISRLLTGSHPDHNFYIAKYVTDVLTDCVYMQEEQLTDVPSKPAMQLKEILDSRYQEALTLDSLAEELRISKYRLCREFTSCYRISPLQYLNNRRIYVATDLLRSTDWTIREVGEAVGIPNTTHFISLFKREHGTTPLRFREMHNHFNV